MSLIEAVAEALELVEAPSSETYARAALDAIKAAGYRIVPVEVTDAMSNAFIDPPRQARRVRRSDNAGRRMTSPRYSATEAA